ncbi:unnamed protein product [Closterium sp. NIES-64]|nr:unnamed protein product [Closterium sp. NIES-64]CAI5994773.1 unnamed protein product [Closterium sp. NIES-65]CAI6002429.1 unnamed protein product [Closterium sp. NIES-65]
MAGRRTRGERETRGTGRGRSRAGFRHVERMQRRDGAEQVSGTWRECRGGMEQEEQSRFQARGENAEEGWSRRSRAGFRHVERMQSRWDGAGGAEQVSGTWRECRGGMEQEEQSRFQARGENAEEGWSRRSRAGFRHVERMQSRWDGAGGAEQVSGTWRECRGGMEQEEQSRFQARGENAEEGWSRRSRAGFRHVERMQSRWDGAGGAEQVSGTWRECRGGMEQEEQSRFQARGENAEEGWSRRSRAGFRHVERMQRRDGAGGAEQVSGTWRECRGGMEQEEQSRFQARGENAEEGWSRAGFRHVERMQRRDGAGGAEHPPDEEVVAITHLL